MFGLTQGEFLLFLLILVRMTGLFILAPVFAHQSVPVQVKPWFALACSLVVYPMLAGHGPAIPATVPALAAMIGRELLVGACVGYLALLVFAAAQYAGELIDTQIGFGMANLIDPSFGSNITVLGQVHFLLATMIYLAVDGHHLLIGAVVRSYGLIPFGQAELGPELIRLIVERFSGMFVIAMRMALPAAACLLIAEVALGVMARAVPQMNVLMVGFPLKIGVGLIVLGVVLPSTGAYFVGVLSKLAEALSAALGAM